MQVAQASDAADRDTWLDSVEKNGPSGEPIWWVDPEPPANGVTYLRRVVLGAPDPAALLPLYRDLLGGTIVAKDADGTELEWPGGGRIRVERRDGQAPGVDRLEVEGLAAPTNVLGTWFTPSN